MALKQYTFCKKILIGAAGAMEVVELSSTNLLHKPGNREEIRRNKFAGVIFRSSDEDHSWICRFCSFGQYHTNSEKNA